VDRPEEISPQGTGPGNRPDGATPQASAVFGAETGVGFVAQVSTNSYLEDHSEGPFDSCEEVVLATFGAGAALGAVGASGAERRRRSGDLGAVDQVAFCQLTRRRADSFRVAISSFPFESLNGVISHQP
jgi:hypothetical protein